MAHPARLLPGEPGAAGRDRGAGGADPAARPAGRRRDGAGVLRGPDARGNHLGRALRRLVEAGPPADAGPAHHDLGRPDHRRGHGGRPVRRSRTPGGSAGQDLPLDYVFDPGRADDGVTVRVPLSLLNQLDPAEFSWQVPGLRRELATELIRSLPKAVRRHFAPAPEFAERALDWLEQHPSPGPETAGHRTRASPAGADRGAGQPGRLGPRGGPGPPAGQLRRADRTTSRPASRWPRVAIWLRLPSSWPLG